MRQLPAGSSPHSLAENDDDTQMRDYLLLKSDGEKVLKTEFSRAPFFYCSFPFCEGACIYSIKSVNQEN